MTGNESNSGFSIVEALLILVIIGILGFTGWYVYHAKQASDKNYSTANSSTVPIYKKKVATKTTATANPYAGWKTFCSSVTNACFKYDPTWTFAQCSPTQVNMKNYFQDCGQIEDVSLISPNNTRIDWYLLNANDLSVSQCANDPSKVSYSDITQVPNASNLFYVNINDSENIAGGYIDRLALRNGDNGQAPTPSFAGAICPGFDYFSTQDGKYVASFGLNYSVNDKPQFNTDLPNQSDLSIVKQTLLSFYYK
ncbi:MAG TPA: hypothetical protein VMB52_01415 [Verrucomicrobiae bacterium]|nr:hypothetical protein [Verrucomicrobiae bacterium]